MDASVAPTNISADQAKPPRRRPPPRQGPSNPDTNSDAAAGPSTSGGQPRRRHNRPKRVGAGDGEEKKEGGKGLGGKRREGEGAGQSNDTAGSTSKSGGKSGQRGTKTRKPKLQGSNAIPGEGHVQAGADQSQAAELSGDSKRKRRAPRFNGGLTEESQKSSLDVKEKVSNAARYTHLPKKDDLTSRLIRELSVSPYQDCLICFAPIHPAQPTWSCSPLMPISAATDDEDGTDTVKVAGTAQCCWATFHLKCIRQWAGKSVKNIEDAWRARGEERKGEWRCPGCQSKRAVVPASYWYAFVHICACKHV